MEILHFPLRSYSHFENKIVKGGQAYERNTELDREVGRTWRHLYERYKAGELLQYYRGEMLTDEALNEGMKDGTLVVDRRLHEALEALYGPT